MNTISSLTRRRALIAALIVFSILSQACDKDKVHAAAKAADQIQIVTDKGLDTTSELLHANIITKAKAREITLAIQKIHEANGALINLAAGMAADTASNRCALAAQLQLVLDALKELKATGVLGIKSANGSLVFDTMINGLKTDIGVVAAALGDCGATVKVGEV